LTEQNGGQVIRDKVDVVGPNEQVPLIAFDGFAQQATIDDAGSSAESMYAGVPGSAPENLPGGGAGFVADLEDRLDGRPVEQFAPPAGEAAAVLLDAIAEAGQDRPAIIEALFATRGGGGILADYDIEPSGDPSVGPVTILRAGATFEPELEVRPEDRLVAAARG
jgi:branched-chain amino acid transport system substrate-binding protein